VRYFISTLFLAFDFFVLNAQQPEEQQSFVSFPKSHEYYVQQAELWWKEIQKDSLSENNWKNYFGACRNAQASADRGKKGEEKWSDDFTKESPYLRKGSDILDSMSKHIPSSFTYNLLMWFEQGFNPERATYLLKAYEMNPDYSDIQAPMVAYLTSEFDFEKRAEVCKKWFEQNTISPGFLAYGYNMLMSLEPNSIILTHYDWDTFPIWILQDVKDVRKDVLLINFDMLLIKSYRDKVFDKLFNLPQIEKEVPERTSLENLQTIFDYIIINYSGSRPLYISLTANEELYKKYFDNLYISGITLKYSKQEVDEIEINKQYFENDFLLDYLKIQFTDDPRQERVDNWNKNYLKSFELLYQYYKKEGDTKKLNKIKELVTLIAKTGDEELRRKVSETFK
jgi:hypothetical protein